MTDSKTTRSRPVSLSYLFSTELEGYLSQHQDHVGCIVRFGSHRGADTVAGYPVLWVDMPVAGDETVYEVWTCDRPVIARRDGMISGSANEDLYWGALALPAGEGGDLAEASRRVFAAIFEFLRDSGYSNLIRVWNYFPRINEEESGMERYRSFTLGRHEAFMHCGRSVEDSPAACALGSYGGPLIIYFLASRLPGVQVENPRQISAYKYPEQYGPRSPTFSRATLAFRGNPQVLFISGTASIVGHETVHLDSVNLQTQETLANLRAVIEQAGRQGFRPGDYSRSLTFKVYVRHSGDISEVEKIIRREFGELAGMLVLQADICRTDLLVEIEATCWSGE